MRILLDTNIIIHREANKAHNADIGSLFKWIDNLKYEKWVHHLSISEIEKYGDNEVVETMKIKIENYNIHKFDSTDKPEITELKKSDKNLNDEVDTAILKEVYSGKFDILITQDKKLYQKSVRLGIQHKVYSIDHFLNKVTAENPGLREYKVLAVKKVHFGNLNLNDSFFDSFKKDYKEFQDWFLRKSENEAYVCLTDDVIKAFLFLKVEYVDENYSNINPVFQPKKRLKVGTLKVESTGYKLGERFLKIIFDIAWDNKVDEIYVTIFNKREEQLRLIELLSSWGFVEWGSKITDNGIEKVFIRSIKNIVDNNPKNFYPFIKRSAKKYFVSINPKYHFDLLPDSKLNNEKGLDYTEQKAHRNAIQKVYISRALSSEIKRGDVLLFYRTKDNGPAKFTSVITSLGVVENVFFNIKTYDDFQSLCQKRSVFTDLQLKKGWDGKTNKPFVVHFLFNYSLPKRLTLSRLIELGIVSDVMNVPRGFHELNDSKFNLIMKESQADESIIID